MRCDFKNLKTKFKLQSHKAFIVVFLEWMRGSTSCICQVPFRSTEKIIRERKKKCGVIKWISWRQDNNCNVSKETRSALPSFPILGKTNISLIHWTRVNQPTFISQTSYFERRKANLEANWIPEVKNLDLSFLIKTYLYGNAARSIQITTPNLILI